MRRPILLSAILAFSLSAHGQVENLKREIQQRGEAVIQMSRADVSPSDHIDRIVSIDHFESNDSLRAYVTSRQLDAFVALDIPYTLLPSPNENFHPDMIDVATWEAKKSTDCANALTAYPTYDLYETLMTDFATDFPEICRLEEIATLPSGRKLLAVKITDNPDDDEAEPRFLYSSTMHGDETAGYILMLRLIRELLCSYGTDDRVTTLVNEVEIWINPLANPDGTYHGGNHTVANARRTNSNFVDLNRNFPDPDDGLHPDGNPHQPETQAFMAFAETYAFNMSSNLHGGAEVANYPWDTWSHAHPDEDWWMDVCRQYADSAQEHSPWYYMDGFDNGITNGYDWYHVAGGRQDYTNYFHRGREMTLELSNTKLLPSSQFDDYWNYNRAALYAYLEQSLFGLRGLITDAITGEGLAGEVSIATHDYDQSEVFGRLPHGNYHRYLAPGEYEVTFSAEGYQSQTHTLTSHWGESTVWDVALMPDNPCTVSGGTITTSDPTTDLCSGDGDPDWIQVTLEGASGFGSVFGMVNSANNVVASAQSGLFNMENFPADTYRIYHLSYAQGVNVNVGHPSELSGCYDLSNPLVIKNYRVEGGTISATGSTTLCGNDGEPSTLDVTVDDAQGPFSKWAVLTPGFTSVVSVSPSPDFNFDNFGPGSYRLVHVAYGYGVNLGQQDPQNPTGCIDVSNAIAVDVIPCTTAEVVSASSTGFKIRVTSPETGGMNLRLLDMSGRILHAENLGVWPQGVSHMHEVTTPTLAAGMYMCVVEVNGKPDATKFVLSR